MMQCFLHQQYPMQGCCIEALRGGTLQKSSWLTGGCFGAQLHSCTNVQLCSGSRDRGLSASATQRLNASAPRRLSASAFQLRIYYQYCYHLRWYYTITTTSQLLHSYSTVTPQLLHSYSTVTACRTLDKEAIPTEVKRIIIKQLVLLLLTQ